MKTKRGLHLQRNKGFSIIELVVVIAVMVILTGTVSMGYAGLVIWVGGLWSELGFQCEDAHLSPSISSFHCKERKKKSGVLLVCDFLALGLRVNFSLVGKQSLLSVTVEL